MLLNHTSSNSYHHGCNYMQRFCRLPYPLEYRKDLHEILFFITFPHNISLPIQCAGITPIVRKLE